MDRSALPRPDDMVAYAFLQSRRLQQARGGKKSPALPPQPTLPAVGPAIIGYLIAPSTTRCPHCAKSLNRSLHNLLK